MFVRYRKESFALEIADSEISAQLSMSRTLSRLAAFANFKKSFVEMVVPRRLMLVILVKNFKGTFLYKFPVLAKSIFSQLRKAVVIGEAQRNTNCHHEKHTADTLTRSSG